MMQSTRKKYIYLPLEITNDDSIKHADDNVSRNFPEFPTEELPENDTRHWDIIFYPTPGEGRLSIIDGVQSVNIKSQGYWEYNN